MSRCRMVTAGGVTHSCATWDRLKSLPTGTVLRRISKGMSPDDAVGIPRTVKGNPIAKIIYMGKTFTIQEWADRARLPESVIHARMSSARAIREIFPSDNNKKGFLSVLQTTAPSKYDRANDGLLCELDNPSVTDHEFRNARLMSDALERYVDLFQTIFGSGFYVDYTLRRIRRALLGRYRSKVTAAVVQYAEHWAAHFLLGEDRPCCHMQCATQRAAEDYGLLEYEKESDRGIPNYLVLSTAGWQDYLEYRRSEDEVLTNMYSSLSSIRDKAISGASSGKIHKVKMRYIVEQELLIEVEDQDDLLSKLREQYISVSSNTYTWSGVESLYDSIKSVSVVSDQVIDSGVGKDVSKIMFSDLIKSMIEYL